MTTRRGDIIAISSHVARGSVGLRAMSFALERLGFAVWAVPTILLPYHPGHGPGERIVPDDAAFARLVAALSDRRLDGVAAIVSGYVASPPRRRRSPASSPPPRRRAPTRYMSATR